MTNVAILGFGVVGGGVADLITKNEEQVKKLGGDAVFVKYVLDLRDFPDSPFADRVVHNFDVILEDKSISTVIEVMGGSHPAYEYTVAALKAGKNVITSNKEVVASFGDEFLALAHETGVSYRFEAAVGGGIPVISPLINCVLQNRPCEVRGILNGTTNYILTKMFTYGESFSSALADAQARGYAERNPDADVLGYDAARKIAILCAIVTGKLISTDKIYTQGITEIRIDDVKALERVGCSIKLVGRCIVGESPMLMVCPFVVPGDASLYGVSGVYNAVEFVGEPLGNVMFYGKGAGAGATASAVVGDLMLVMRSGVNAAAPVFEKVEKGADFDGFSCRRYVAVSEADKSAAAEVFGELNVISEQSGEIAFITPVMSEVEYRERAGKISVRSHIRML